MRKDNTQNYKTELTNIRHYRDLTDNVGAEKAELKKMKHNAQKNVDGSNLANLVRKKWNKVTKKWDDIWDDEIDSRLSEIDFEEPAHKFKFTNDEVNPNHFFKNNTEVVEPVKIKKFEAFFTTGIDDPAIPRENRPIGQNWNHPMPADEEVEEGCGCCDECTGESDCDCCEDCICDEMDHYGESCDCEDYDDYDDEDDYYDEDDCDCDNYDDCGCDESESYMFFGNLETIHGMCEEMLQMDQEEVDDKLADGHNWAEDHVSTAKESLSHVYNFLKGNRFRSLNNDKSKQSGGLVKNIIKGVEEFIDDISESHVSNYMFFSNLEHIHRFCQEILDLDKDMIDDKLQSGHDWAEDHVSAAKENIQQVYDWLQIN